jgi:hypothetical protein
MNCNPGDLVWTHSISKHRELRLERNIEGFDQQCWRDSFQIGLVMSETFLHEFAPNPRTGEREIHPAVKVLTPYDNLVIRRLSRLRTVDHVEREQKVNGIYKEIRGGLAQVQALLRD